MLALDCVGLWTEFVIWPELAISSTPATQSPPCNQTSLGQATAPLISTSSQRWGSFACSGLIWIQNHMPYHFLLSLKNPSHPEYTCLAHCGVLSLDINKTYPHLVVAGLYDGNVAVYNLCRLVSSQMEGEISFVFIAVARAARSANQATCQARAMESTASLSGKSTFLIFGNFFFTICLTKYIVGKSTGPQTTWTATRTSTAAPAMVG